MRTLALLALMAAPASAMEWSDFDTLPVEQQIAYVKGAGEALASGNAMLAYTKNTLLYCSPGDEVIPLETYMKLAEDQRDPQLPVEMSLLFGLMAEFPCKSL